MTSSAYSNATHHTKSHNFRRRIFMLPWKRSFYDAFSEFCTRTDACGMRYIVEPKRKFLEKLLWVILEILAITVSIYLVLTRWTDFTSNPTVTTLDNQNFPVSKVPFPAIGLCNTNRLSQRAVRKYASDLVRKARRFNEENTEVQINSTETDHDDFFKKLRYLGRLIDFDIEGYETFLNFQELIETIDPGDDGQPWNVEKIMEKLTPKCEDLLILCKFKNIEKNCTDLFELRKTALGQCCVFNTIREDENFVEKQVEYPPSIGPEFGLNVVINTSTVDFYYQPFSFTGVFFMLFDPLEFPDISLGNTRNEILDPNTENFIRLSLKTNEAEEEIKNYGVEKRNCLFKDENFKEYHGMYTYTECVLKCKIKSILDLCNCIPFFMPGNHEDLVKKTTTRCTLAHVPCLNKYRIKWRTMAPSIEGIPGLEQEYQDSLFCPQCFALCSYNLYSLETTFNPITKNPPDGLLSRYTNIRGLAMVHVYFAEYTGSMYKTSVTLTWYDLLSNFGGLISLVIGTSIISFIEVFYFGVYRFYQYMTHEFGNERNDLKISLKQEMYPSKKKSQKPPSYSAIERTLYDEYSKRHFM